MRRRPRTKYTDTQKALMWERWKKGETLHQIARLFDRPHTSIRQILAESGGIRPPERRRSKLALTLAEREEISRALVAGESIRAVAARLARAPSTISREITRNGGASCYRAAQADQAAWQRAHRPKQCKLAQNSTLARLVTHKLQSQWSPEQIAGWLKHTYPGNESLQVSHEAIYRSLFIQARGALKKELLQSRLFRLAASGQAAEVEAEGAHLASRKLPGDRLRAVREDVRDGLERRGR